MAKSLASRGLQTAVKLPNAPVGAYHAHGCDKCSNRYTDRCTTPKTNGLCQACKNGTDRATWDKDQDPRECCRTSSTLVTDGADITRYSLGGPGPWFRCKKCSRTHPYDPTRRSS